MLQTAFFCSGVTRTAFMGSAGDVNRDLFILLAWTLVPATLAIALGKRALEHISKKALRFVVFSFVLVMGTLYLFRPEMLAR